MSYVKNWCFTEHNIELNPFDWEQQGVRFAIWQLEECPSSGKKHLQGYVQLSDKKRIGFLKKLSPTAHWEAAKGTADENCKYCTKEETRKDGPWQFGNMVRERERSDLKRCMELIKEGKSVDELLLEEPTAITHGRGLRDLERVTKRLHAKDRFLAAELYGWQREIVDMLSTQTEREVLWVYDTVGNTGKTYLSNVLDFKHNYQSFMGGKYADMAYAIQCDRDGYVIDLARTSEEFCCYNFMESIKNRRVFSTKYDSGTKYLRSFRLVVFSNYLPDLSKLSRDRWRLVELIKTPLSPTDCVLKHHAL